MIQYDVYKTPSSKEEQNRLHTRAVDKGVITYDKLKKNLKYASSARPESFHTAYRTERQ
jgi:hypothetical protein